MHAENSRDIKGRLCCANKLHYSLAFRLTVELEIFSCQLEHIKRITISRLKIADECKAEKERN